MSHGANAVHKNLRNALKNYIVSQYFGKSPVLLTAIEGKLDTEGLLYQRAFIESSPAYRTETDGIQNSKVLPEWVKEYFKQLSEAGLGVFPSPFQHQIAALEAAYCGEDLFVSTGTGSGKSECFLWPMMEALADEARNDPSGWESRGVRALIMYPMNALVSDQISRLRKLLGDPEQKFLQIFKDTCGESVRRPQFGMYTGRTPYPGKRPKHDEDVKIEKNYRKIVEYDDEDGERFFRKLQHDGRLPAKISLPTFLDKLHKGEHKADPLDAELVTRYEMQTACPDILITNYSMLEYMLMRPIENGIWDCTIEWLNKNPEKKLLFIIDEAHMYRGSAGGEVSLLIRRLFHRLGIDRNRVQFILTTASMPDATTEDRECVLKFANALTGADEKHKFRYLTGQQKDLSAGENLDIPFDAFSKVVPDSFEGNDSEKLRAINTFWKGLKGFQGPFSSLDDAGEWLYRSLPSYKQFCDLLLMCRGSAASLEELSAHIFKDKDQESAMNAVSVMLAMSPLAKNKDGSILFPARMHMLFRGIHGVYACTNPDCSCGYEADGLRIGEVYFSGGTYFCKKCGSLVYELYNDRRCGSIFFRGFVLKDEVDSQRRTYLWHHPGYLDVTKVREIHLYIPTDIDKPPKGTAQYKAGRCYLDVKSGFVSFTDDSLDGEPGIRVLYYSFFEASGKPGIYTFSTCPHCKHELSKMQLTSFSTRGNQSFFNLIKEQFLEQPPVPEKAGNPEMFPNEGRKVLIFSDSRQRAAKLARDMSDTSEMTAARQLAVLAIQNMEKEDEEQTLNEFYDFFAMAAAENHVALFHEDQERFAEQGRQLLETFRRRKRRGQSHKHKYNIEAAPEKVKQYILSFYCGGYNTLVDAALSWLEATEEQTDQALEKLYDSGLDVSEKEFQEFFNAWILEACDKNVILGNSISDATRRQVRPVYTGYGLSKDWKFSTRIMDLMGWGKADAESRAWRDVLNRFFLTESSNNPDKLFVDLSSVKPRFDPNHVWFRCSQCSELTPYTIHSQCPSCKSSLVHPMTQDEINALAFWRKPADDVLSGVPIRVIDTEEHTAQVSHKDQRDTLWSKTEEYELRFQDFLNKGQVPVDILSSTTTMEVGIDIGSLVAVGLRNIPPTRENYQQRAGRAGRRGASLSTIVTFCEDGPHDSIYFKNPVPMLRGEPRRPWIDTDSEKLIQRHLSLIAIEEYLREKGFSIDSISAIDFIDNHIEPFKGFLTSFDISPEDVLIPRNGQSALYSYKNSFISSLLALCKKREDHPELYDDESDERSTKKSLLDSLYEEGVIPTYSFPLDVVGAYIPDGRGKINYKIERDMSVALSEYAPGRSIVVDKTTYQIGGLYYPGAEKRKGAMTSPAKGYVNDPNYHKDMVSCPKCNWFGISSGQDDRCPFCGEIGLIDMLPMLKPWGFAPLNANSISTAELKEQYSSAQQPLYSTLPESDIMQSVPGYQNVRVAVRSNQRIIMLNKGDKSKGFVVCCDCGAALPGDSSDVLKNVKRPYVPVGVRSKCLHPMTENVFLGYDFVTDMLVLEFKLERMQLSIIPQKNYWLNRAGITLAESLRIAVCNELDVEFTELVTGYRFRRNDKGDFLDVYIYDELSSGAGYAVSIQSIVPTILSRTKKLLDDCTCELACYDCLKHYRNQFVHESLDRRAASQLLEWGKSGKTAAALSFDEQKATVQPLVSIMKNAGIEPEITGGEIWLKGRYAKKKLVVYPEMWAQPKEKETVFVSDTQMKYSRPLALDEILTRL